MYVSLRIIHLQWFKKNLFEDLEKATKNVTGVFIKHTIKAYFY